MSTQKNISPIGFEKYITAVEIAFINREQYVFNISVCQKKKNTLTIVHQQNELDFDACKKLLKKLPSFFLIITGKPVIAKKLSRFYENTSELIQAVLPDAKQADFVGQCWEFKGQFYGSAMRSEQFEQLLKQLGGQKLFAERVYLGPYLPCLVGDLTTQENISFSTQNATYTFEENTLLTLSPSEKENSTPIKIGSDTVISYSLPTLCACINAGIQAINTTLVNSSVAHTQLIEYKYKKRFKLLLNIAVFAMLLLVTTNYFLNRHIAKKHSDLEDRLALNQQALTSIQKLEAEVEEKRALVGKRAMNNGPVIAIMSDQLAATVPNAIRLLNLEVFPLNGKIQKDKPVLFAYNKLVVEGVTNQSEDLDEWIKTCKKLPWVKDIALIRYAFNNEQNKGTFKIEFSL